MSEMNNQNEKTYQEKLRDPRWQRLRLEVMQAAHWVCEDCGDGREELHVHHDFYRAGHEPWQYPANDLKCICTTCHQIRHLDEKKLRIRMAKLVASDEECKVFMEDAGKKAKAKMEALLADIAAKKAAQNEAKTS